MKIPSLTYAKLLYEILNDVQDQSVTQEKIRAVIELIYRNSQDVTLLDSLARVFEEYYDVVSGVEKVNITTAVKLSDEDKKKLLESVKKLLDEKNIDPMFNVNPALLGGVTVETANRLFDASVNSSLSILQKHVER